MHMKSSNTETTATITWESGGIDVSYTVFSSSAEAPITGITQTSYTLHDLKVETDYVVSVTATNYECDIESPPSEEITIRIDAQGIYLMSMYASSIIFHVTKILLHIHYVHSEVYSHFFLMNRVHVVSTSIMSFCFK